MCYNAQNSTIESTLMKERETHEQESPGRGSRRKARTRADLLAAARQVFAARGYHEASIAEITHIADVGVGTFYLHFHDKDEAFHTLLQEGILTIRTHVMDTLLHESHEITLDEIIKVILRQAYEQRDLFRIALTGGKEVRHPLRAQAVLLEGLSEFLSSMADKLMGYDIPLLARILTGIITQGISGWFDSDEPTPEHIAEQMIRLLQQGLPASLFSQTS